MLLLSGCVPCVLGLILIEIGIVLAHIRKVRICRLTLLHTALHLALSLIAVRLGNGIAGLILEIAGLILKILLLLRHLLILLLSLTLHWLILIGLILILLRQLILIRLLLLILLLRLLLRSRRHLHPGLPSHLLQAVLPACRLRRPRAVPPAPPRTPRTTTCPSRRSTHSERNSG